MKKLNRKGFTLVELLAVIIILAIVVGITIPTVMNTVNTSKDNALNVAINAAENWLQDQAVIYNTNTNLVDPNFPTSIFDGKVTLNSSANSAQLNAMGLKAKDIAEITIEYNSSTQKICVTATQIIKNGSYYNTAYWSESTTDTTAAESTTGTTAAEPTSGTIVAKPKSEPAPRNKSNGC